MTDQAQPTQTPEQQDAAVKELQGRVEEFNKELLPLLGKYELGLGASAFINANGTIAARPIMFDARKQAEAAQAPAAGESTPPAEPAKLSEA